MMACLVSQQVTSGGGEPKAWPRDLDRKRCSTPLATYHLALRKLHGSGPGPVRNSGLRSPESNRFLHSPWFVRSQTRPRILGRLPDGAYALRGFSRPLHLAPGAVREFSRTLQSAGNGIRPARTCLRRQESCQVSPRSPLGVEKSRARSASLEHALRTADLRSRPGLLGFSVSPMLRESFRHLPSEVP